MVGQTILHYKIMEKLGEPACPAYRSGSRQAGAEWTNSLFRSEL